MEEFFFEMLPFLLVVGGDLAVSAGVCCQLRCCRFSSISRMS